MSDRCLIQAIVAKAEAGDKSMKRIFEQMGRYLGLGIANLVNLLNPQRVVICQGAIRCAHLFEDSLRSVAEQMVIPPLKRNLEIVIHHWGDEVWARGAASLVLLELDQRGRSEMPKAFLCFRSACRPKWENPRRGQLRVNLNCAFSANQSVRPETPLLVGNVGLCSRTEPERPLALRIEAL